MLMEPLLEPPGFRFSPPAGQRTDGLIPDHQENRSVPFLYPVNFLFAFSVLALLSAAL